MCGKLRGMPQENGKLSLSTLTRLSVGGYLTTAAANSFERLRLAGARDGVNVTITSTADAYREYTIQERIFTERYIPTYTEYATGKVDKRYWQGRYWFRRRGTAAAAVPGTSNHGWAIAIDIANVGGFNSTFYLWLSNNAPALGWSNDEGRSVAEYWHWTFRTSQDTGGGGSSAPAPTPTPEEEDDMPTASEVANAVLNTPDPALGGRTVHQVLSSLVRVPTDVDTVNKKMDGVVTDSRDAVLEGRARAKTLAGIVIDARDAANGAKALPGITIDARDSVLGNREIIAQVAGLKVALDTLAAGQGLDPEAVTAAVDAGVSSALSRIETTVSVKPEASK